MPHMSAQVPVTVYFSQKCKSHEHPIWILPDIFRSFNRCCYRARSSKSESIWEVTGIPLPCLSQSILGLRENKRPHRKRVLCRKFELQVREVLWWITLFLCRHQWDLWLFMVWTQTQKEADSNGDSGTAPLCQKLPCTPGQQAGTFWKVILQANIPLACFATSSTDEWSEANRKGFLQEVSPEGLKAEGKGKLRLGQQQAPG